MDRAAFYSMVRKRPFSGSLNQGQVDGMEALLDKGLAQNTDLRWIAYTLGTSFHETARTMRPIEEYGRGAGRPYGVPDPVTHKAYYGRSFVQLTWKENYAAMGKRLGIDLVRNPERALELTVATDIIYTGMREGSFTGGRFSLPVFFNSKVSDWYNARRIVNGLDRAQDIASYSLAFYRAAIAASGQKLHMASLGAPRLEPSLAGAEPDYVALEKDALMADL